MRTATDMARLRQMTLRSEVPDPNPRGLESVQAACLEFLRKRGLTHKMTSRCGAILAQRTEDTIKSKTVMTHVMTPWEKPNT